MLAAASILTLSVSILACPDAARETGLPIVETATAVAGSGMPYDGVVLGDTVNLRAGPGSAYEVVAHLKGGTRVEVLGEAFGWLLVHPSIDLAVYVSREMVELKGDGVGLVTRDRVNLRSRAALDSTVLGQMNRGDLVRVIEDRQDFFAIAAPAEVAFYVHGDLVKAAPREATVAASVPKSAPEPVPAPGPSAAEMVRRARELYQAELAKKDIGAMDFGAAESLYAEAARDAAHEPLRAAALAGLKRVRLAIELQRDFRRRVGPIERMVGADREPCAPAPR
jgi:hypothetical protein